ncbi:MAG: 50S ribosomal protein L30 [Candidatus Thermoplasmatota archaeon]|nr:50S ribosomal protein L30 [Candidatus Thermoplasmatota archaeon]
MYAVVRVRGTVNIKPDIKKTLKLLSLSRANHCVLVEETPSTKGMLQTAKDYVTWGEIDREVLSKLIKRRGKLEGDQDITDDYIKSATSYDNVEMLSEAIIEKKISYKEIPNVKPIFRLSPPKKGYDGIKMSFVKGGALGYRGKEINRLIERML